MRVLCFVSMEIATNFLKPPPTPNPVATFEARKLALTVIGANSIHQLQISDTTRELGAVAGWWVVGHQLMKLAQPVLSAHLPMLRRLLVPLI